MCARVFVNLVRTATTKNDNAGVQAGKFILSCRAGWRETSTLEIEQATGAGLTAILKIVSEAPAPSLDTLHALARAPDLQTPEPYSAARH
jgi:hypothetical protein